ncbi:hypothetical protein [Methanosarcina barkeri]|uniref:Uncharacterized protein n=1 Tax=Methanosarcina barkeri 227 TaxID=1434106 RepID=A0A0E3LPQ4_METBA|nr:hypothetical protein [Methanosarcina barkeri]AKB56926.1 hypothetical protein MSBR2_0410 [Methanosarcina barkeri 227]
MKKETKSTVGSDLSSYNVEETNYEKMSELYGHSDSSYLKTITEETSHGELISTKRKENYKLEIDERYQVNTPVRIKIRARIINDKG